MEHGQLVPDWGYIVECAPGDRRIFENHAATSPSVRDLHQRGTKALRSFPQLLADAFWFFYSPQATLKDERKFWTDRFNYLLLKFLFDSADYQKLRSRTILNQNLALAATEQLGEFLLQHISSGTSRKSNSTSPSGEVTIDGIAFADRVSLGSPSDPGNFGKAVLVLAKAIDDAQDGYTVLSDLARGWGTGPGSFQQLPHQARADLARRIAQNPKLLRLAEIVGKYRHLAIEKHETRIVRLPHEVFDVTQGDELDRVLTQELAALAHSNLRYDFYLRFADRKLHQYDLQGEEKVSRGSLIICIDTSGSMSGEREITSKAIALGLLEIAKREERNCVAILFSSAGEWIAFAFLKDETVCVKTPGAASQRVPFLEGAVRLGTDFFGGGTDYETPLREAIGVIRADDGKCKDADIVFITDDCCDVTDSFMEEYSAVKKERHFSTYSVIVGAPSANAITLKKFSDEVISSFDLTEEVAGQIFERI